MTDFPGVVVNTDHSIVPESVYKHIDDYKEGDAKPSGMVDLHLYVFEHEEGRIDDLLEIKRDLEEDYIFSTAIVWPDWMEGKIDLMNNLVLDVFQWLIVGGEEPEPEDVEVIERHL